VVFVVHPLVHSGARRPGDRLRTVVPEGRCGNSPAIHRWANGTPASPISPGGTTDRGLAFRAVNTCEPRSSSRQVQPSLRDCSCPIVHVHPAINCWATITAPLRGWRFATVRSSAARRVDCSVQNFTCPTGHAFGIIPRRGQTGRPLQVPIRWFASPFLSLRTSGSSYDCAWGRHCSRPFDCRMRIAVGSADRRAKPGCQKGLLTVCRPGIRVNFDPG